MNNLGLISYWIYNYLLNQAGITEPTIDQIAQYSMLANHYYQLISIIAGPILLVLFIVGYCWLAMVFEEKENKRKWSR